jgi:Cu2+-exporting ATPase
MAFPLALIGGGLALAGTASLARRRSLQDRLKSKAAHPPLKPLVAQHHEEISQRRREVNRDLTISISAMISAGIAEFLFPPLLLVAIPLALLSAVSIFRTAVESWRQQRKLHSSVIDSIAIGGSLATGFYFTAAVIMSLYFVGQRFLLQTEDRSSRQLKQLFGEAPRTVWVSREEVEIETPFEDVHVGDIVAIQAGESIPFDGQVVRGAATVDQHMLTGESQPHQKRIGDQVFASTLLTAGKLYIRVEKAGSDTVVSQVGEALQNTLDFKSTIEARGTRVANRMTVPTLALGGFALARCGLVSATALAHCNFADIIRITMPLGVLNHLKLAAEHGILVKDGRALELLGEVDTIVFDKTGTLTQGQPSVGKVHSCNDFTQDQILSIAAAAEYRQSHPVAHAIVAAAQQRGVELAIHEHTQVELGHGIRARVQGLDVMLGSHRFVESEKVAIPECGCWRDEDSGRSLVYLAVDGELTGAIELAAEVRPEVPEVLEKMRERAYQLNIVSGDDQEPTRQLAESLGIEHYFAETLPDDKARIIEELQASGRNVCFIGDGINDAMAMKKARVAISIAGATSVATDTASIVLLDKSLSQLDTLFGLARGFERNVQSGLAWTLLPGIAGAGAVLLVGMGIYGAASLYMFSLGAGVTNASLPYLTQEMRNAPRRSLALAS